jgi:hypothetical protein
MHVIDNVADGITTVHEKKSGSRYLPQSASTHPVAVAGSRYNASAPVEVNVSHGIQSCKD